MTLPNQHITPIPAIDPATGEAPSATPDLWNSRYTEIDDNFAALKNEIGGIENVESDTGQRIDAIVEAIALQAGRIAGIENNSANSVAKALKLDWLYSSRAQVKMELFWDSWTLLPGMKNKVIDAVAGDDSLDVDTTEHIVVGQEYVIFDGHHHESVVVTDILTDSRIRVNINLQYSYKDADLRRCSWDITGGGAKTVLGGVYYSGPVKMAESTGNRGYVMRRTDNESEILVFYKDEAHENWQFVPWFWKRAITSGIVDVEYIFKTKGVFELKVVSMAGEGFQPTTIYHMVLLGAPTGLGGEHHGPEQPINILPAADATDVVTTPTLTAQGYQSSVLSSMGAVRFMVTTNPGDYSEPVWDSGVLENIGLSVAIPVGILVCNKTYYWHVSMRDVEGEWSAWSIETAFSTSATAGSQDPEPTAATPQAIYPSGGMNHIAAQVRLQASTFATKNFTPISLVDGTSNKWNKSSKGAEEYYCIASNVPHHKPASLIAGKNTLQQGVLGSLQPGQWAWGDQDSLGQNRIYVKLSAGDPDDQVADYIQAEDAHISSRWQLLSPQGSVLHDSGTVGPDNTYLLNQGILHAGTDYIWQVQYQGEATGWSEWSGQAAFRTKNTFANIIGVALLQPGDGGKWCHVDGDGNRISLDTAAFNNHPVWGGIRDVKIDDQYLTKIPKFYCKVGKLTTGNCSGKKAWLISDTPAPGFILHSAFMDHGSQIDQIYVGKYEGTYDSNDKLGSQPGKQVVTDQTSSWFRSRCQNRNTGGVDGFHQLNIYEAGAMQMLILIEKATPKIEDAFNLGAYGNDLMRTGAANCHWRGIHDLFGNASCFLDGLKAVAKTGLMIFDKKGSQEYVTLVPEPANTSGFTYFFGSPLSMKEDVGEKFDCRHIFVGNVCIDSGHSTQQVGTFPDSQYGHVATTGDLFFMWGPAINVVSHNGSYSGLFYMANGMPTHSLFGSRIAKI